MTEIPIYGNAQAVSKGRQVVQMVLKGGSAKWRGKSFLPSWVLLLDYYTMALRTPTNGKRLATCNWNKGNPQEVEGLRSQEG